MPWFKLFRAFFIILAWSKIALKDGKITIEEGYHLIYQLAKLLDLPTEFFNSKLWKSFEELPTNFGPDKDKTG